MKKFISHVIVLFIMFAGSINTGIAQTSIPADSLKAMLVKDWERAKSYTDEYLSTMPNDKYSFKPNDSIRTFAQQMLHLAQANTFFIMTATGEKPSFEGRDLEKIASAQSADSVKYYVDNSYDFAINSIKNLNPQSLMEYKSVNMGQTFNFSRLSWLLKAFEHQTHHRGQSTIYLRTAGYRPPQEKLF